MFSIKSKRLILRDLMAQDWELFYNLMKEPETKYYMEGYLKSETEEDAKTWVKERMDYNSEIPRHSYNLAIECNCKAVGWIGIGEAESIDKKDLNFGYALKKSWWGQGFATEALQTLLKYCFEILPIKRITGECEMKNLASQKVMQKSGMTLEKIFVENDKETLRFIIERN